MAIESVMSQISSGALNKALSNSEGMAGVAQQRSEGGSFKEILSQMDNGADFAKQLDLAGGQDISPMNQVEAIEGNGVSFQPVDQVTETSKPDASQKVLDLLGEVNQGQMQMDSLVNHVLYSGKRFSNQELMVIQAHVFHFAQMTELTVKVAEQGVSSVKSLANTQIQ